MGERRPETQQAIHCLSADLGTIIPTKEEYRSDDKCYHLSGKAVGTAQSLDKELFSIVYLYKNLGVRLDNLAEVLSRPAYLTMSLRVEAVTFSRRKINVTTF